LKKLIPDDLKLAIDRCCRIYGETEMVIVGSMSLLGTVASPTGMLAISDDIDMYPKNLPAEKTLDVAVELGMDSEFFDERGWYVEAVGAWTTSTTPKGWRERLVPVRTAAGCTGWCLAPIDLAFNKIEAGRPKDIEHVARLLQHGYINHLELERAIAEDPREEEIRQRHFGILAQVGDRLNKIGAEEGLPKVPHIPPGRFAGPTETDGRSGVGR
jgi:hypothetical protein